MRLRFLVFCLALALCPGVAFAQTPPPARRPRHRAASERRPHLHPLRPCRYRRRTPAPSPAPAPSPPASVPASARRRSSRPSRATLVPGPGDPTGREEVRAAGQARRVATGISTWDEALRQPKNAFAKIEDELKRAGIAPAGRPLTIFVHTDDQRLSLRGHDPDRSRCPRARPSSPRRSSSARRRRASPSASCTRTPMTRSTAPTRRSRPISTPRRSWRKDAFIEEYVTRFHGFAGHQSRGEHLRSAERMIALFDLDGTLTDPKVGITRSVQYALERLGRPVPEADALTWMIGPPLLAGFTELLGGTHDVQEAVRLYRERYSDVGLFENEVYAGIPASCVSLGDGTFAFRRHVEAACLRAADPRSFRSLQLPLSRSTAPSPTTATPTRAISSGTSSTGSASIRPRRHDRRPEARRHRRQRHRHAVHRRHLGLRLPARSLRMRASPAWSTIPRGWRGRSSRWRRPRLARPQRPEPLAGIPAACERRRRGPAAARRRPRWSAGTCPNGGRAPARRPTIRSARTASSGFMCCGSMNQRGS